MKLHRRFRQARKGTTAIEYALLAALLGLALYTIATPWGAVVNSFFNIASKMD